MGTKRGKKPTSLLGTDTKSLKAKNKRAVGNLNPFGEPWDFRLVDWKWPFQRINSGGSKEYSCPHGVGHGGVHGCDGCCSHPSYRFWTGVKQTEKPIEKRSLNAEH